MPDTVANTLYGISFLLSLIVLVGLWWATAKSAAPRRFWGLLALAWSLNLVADLAWGLLFLVAPDLWLDWIDYLYIGRYLLVFAAFWLYPQPWAWRQWLAILASLILGGLLVWFLIARPAENPDLAYARAGMIFPVMDIGILFAAIYRWREAEASMQKPLFWLSAALLSYGAANWFNYSVRVTNPAGDSIPALILWLLCTILTGVAVWQFLGSEAE